MAIPSRIVTLKLVKYIQSLFGDVNIERVDGCSNYCFLVGGGPEYVIKFDEYENIHSEKYALDRYRASGIPSPAYARIVKSTILGGASALITPFVLHRKENRIPFQQLGALMRRMHRIHASGIGRLVQGKGQNRSWKEYLTQTATKHATSLTKILGYPPGQLLTGIDSLPTLHVLLHGDLHRGNVLCRGKKVVAVIDPDPVVGDPLFDVAMTVQRYPGRASTLFLEGYAPTGFTEGEVRRFNQYLVVAYLNKLGYMLKLLSRPQPKDKAKRYRERKQLYLTALQEILPQ